MGLLRKPSRLCEKPPGRPSCLLEVEWALKPLYISRVRDTTLMHYANRGACRGCALKVQCTSNSYRRIGRYADEAVLDRMAERLADRPGVLHRRRESAEHPFGSIKHWMGHGGFLMRRRSG